MAAHHDSPVCRTVPIRRNQAHRAALMGYLPCPLSTGTSSTTLPLCRLSAETLLYVDMTLCPEVLSTTVLLPLTEMRHEPWRASAQYVGFGAATRNVVINTVDGDDDNLQIGELASNEVEPGFTSLVGHRV